MFSQQPNHEPQRTAKAMIGLATLAVQLPFFIGFILVQLFVVCPHCRGIWRSYWPVLAGRVPILLGRFQILGTSPWGFWLGSSGFTLVFIMILFALSRRSSHWRYVLGAGFLLSCLLARLAHAVIAA